MAQVELARSAVEDLDRLIAVLTLPANTRARLRELLGALEELPDLGTPLTGRWEGLRFILGPWRWMLVVYDHHADEDRVVVLTIQDARASTAATSG